MDDRARKHLELAQGLTEEIAHHIALAFEIMRIVEQPETVVTAVTQPDDVVKKASVPGNDEPDTLAVAVGEGETTNRENVVYLFEW